MDFIQVIDEDDLIKDIYEILRKCGEDMYLNQGLEHWKVPYSIEHIKEDCCDNEVYLVMIPKNEAVATFQLKQKDTMLELSKFGVDPEYAGQGIGSKCLEYMITVCKKKALQGICLDVYDKSLKAIHFYENHGFVQGGGTPHKTLSGIGDGKNYRLVKSYKDFISTIIVYSPIIVVKRV